MTFLRLIKAAAIFQLVSVYFCAACAGLYLMLWIGDGDRTDLHMFLLSLAVGSVIEVYRLATLYVIQAMEEDEDELRTEQ